MDEKKDKIVDMDNQEVNERINSLIAELELLRRVITQGQAIFPRFAEKSVAERRCLDCGLPLGSAKVVRGCHESCHKRISRAIERGELTDDDAISKGWLTPASGGGRPRRADTKSGSFLAKQQIAAEESADYVSEASELAKFAEKKAALRKAATQKKNSDAKKKGTS